MASFWTRTYAAITGRPLEAPPIGEIAVADRYRTVDGLVLYNPAVIDYLTYKQMLKDDQVKAALSLKKFAVLSTPWDIKPASLDPVHQAHADFAKYALLGLSTEFELTILGILTALDFGFSLNEMVWTIYENGKYKGFAGLRAIKTREPADITFATDRFGNLTVIRQFNSVLAAVQGAVPEATYRQALAPMGKFIVYTYMGRFDNPYGNADLQAAYRSWWLKENTYRFLGILLERFGIPPWIARYDKAKLIPQEFTKIQTLLQHAQAASSILVPNSVDFQFPQVAMTGADVFLRTVAVMDAAIARAILLPQQLGFSVEGRFGSFAKAETIFGLFAWVLNFMRRNLTEIVFPRIIKPLVDYNFGPQDEYPYLYWEPLSQEIASELLKLFTDMTTAQIIHPTPTDEDLVRQKLGFPPQPKEAEHPGEILPTEEAFARLRTLLTRQRDELVKFVEGTGQTNDLRLKFLRDIQMVFRELLRVSSGDGKVGSKDYEQLHVIEDRATEATTRLRVELADRIKDAVGKTDGPVGLRLRRVYEPYLQEDALRAHVDELLKAAVSRR